MVKLYTIIATALAINEVIEFLQLNHIWGSGNDTASFVGTHDLDPITFASFNNKKTIAEIKDDFMFMSSWVGMSKLYFACMLFVTALVCKDYIARACCSMMLCIISTICYVSFYDKLMILYNIKEITDENIWIKYNVGLTVMIILFGIATFQEIVAWSGDPVLRPIFQAPNNADADKKKDD